LAKHKPKNIEYKIKFELGKIRKQKKPAIIRSFGDGQVIFENGLNEQVE
jgi:hypothetical protein